MNYSIEQISDFLKTWGKAFKSLDKKKHPLQDAYYQACIDAYQNINKKPHFFYTVSGLQRTLLLIANDFEAEYKQRKQGKDYQERAELLRHIVKNLLIISPKGEQTTLEL